MKTISVLWADDPEDGKLMRIPGSRGEISIDAENIETTREILVFAAREVSNGEFPLLWITRQVG